MVCCTSSGPGNRLACISELEGEDLMAPVSILMSSPVQFFRLFFDINWIETSFLGFPKMLGL